MDEIEMFWDERLRSTKARSDWAAQILRNDRQIARMCRKADAAVLSASQKDVANIAGAVRSILIRKWKAPHRGFAARKSLKNSMFISVAICVSDSEQPNQPQTYRIFPSLGLSSTHCSRVSSGSIKSGDAVLRVLYGTEEWMAVLPSGQIKTFIETAVRAGQSPEFPLNEIAREAITNQLRHTRKLIDRCRVAALAERDLILARNLHSSRLHEDISDRKAAWGRVQFPVDLKLLLMKQTERIVNLETQTPESLLLFGPPGTGKTFFCEQLATMTGWSFHRIKPSDLKQRYIGHSGQATRELWTKLRRQPSILVLEECESIFAKRESLESDKLSGEILQTFLSEWNGNADNVWVIGTTNRPKMMDPAILSRFSRRIEVPLPGQAERRGILLANLPAGVNEEVIDTCAAETQGLVGRTIVQIANRVRALPSPISIDDVMREIRQVRAQNNTHVDEQATWERLVLSEDTLLTLKTTCAILQNAKQWASRGADIPKSILLHGAPGTGKTEIGRTIGNQSKLTFLSATLAELKGTHIGESGERIRALFEKARAAAPAIVFLDELDVLAPARSGRAKDAFTDEITSQLLQETQGVAVQSNEVFVLAATNHMDKVDPAIVSRFEDKIEIPLPNRDGKIRLLVQALNGKPLAFEPRAEAENLVDRLGGFSGREIFNMVKRAQVRALNRAVAEGGPDEFIILPGDLAAEVKPIV